MLLGVTKWEQAGFSTTRDKALPNIFWLRDENLEDSDNLPAPDVLAQDIVVDLEAALEQFREIAVECWHEDW